MRVTGIPLPWPHICIAAPLPYKRAKFCYVSVCFCFCRLTRKSDPINFKAVMLFLPDRFCQMNLLTGAIFYPRIYVELKTTCCILNITDWCLVVSEKNLFHIISIWQIMRPPWCGPYPRGTVGRIYNENCLTF